MPIGTAEELLYLAPNVCTFITSVPEQSKGLMNSIPLSALSVSIHHLDNTYDYYGTSDDAQTGWNTTQTNDALMTGLSGSNTWIIATQGNLARDLGFAASTNPQLVITSATSWASATNQWMRFYFDPTANGGTGAGIIDTGVGPVILNDEVYATTHLHMGDNDVLYKGTGDDSLEKFDGTDHLWTFASLSTADADGGDWRVTGQAGGTGGTGNHAGGDIDLIVGAKAGSGTDGLVNLQGMVKLWDRGKTANTYATLDVALSTATAFTLDLGSVLTTGIDMKWSGVSALKIDDATIATYAATAAAGKDIYARFQDGAANGAGAGYNAGTVTITTGTGGAGTGAAGGAGGSLAVVLGLGGTGTSSGAQGTMTVNGPVSITPATAVAGLTITQAQAAKGLYISQTNVNFYAQESYGKYGCLISQNFPDGRALHVSRNNADAESEALVQFINDNTTDTFATLLLGNDGTAAGSVHITTRATNENLRIMPNGTGEVWFGYNSVQNLHMSGAAVAAYSALTNVDGASCYIAMQNALDLNKNGGSLYWSGGTAHGSGTGGSLFLTPGGTTSGSRGAVVVYQSGIAATSTDALVLENATASTESVTVQYSPGLRFRAHAWDTPTDLVDRTSDFRIYNWAYSDATVYGELRFEHSLAGAAYTVPFKFTSGGNATFLGSVGCTTVNQNANNSTLTVQSRAFSAADSAIEACTGTWTHSSGEGVAFELKPTWNASGTASETCLKINSTSTAVGSGAYLLINALDDTASRWSLGGDGKVTGTVTQSIAAAGSEWNLAAGTTTITAGVTAIHGLQIDQMTVTAGSALTADAAASLYIANAPVAGGSATVTAAYSLWVDAGNVRFDGSLGDTTNRVVKGWFTDLEVTNAPTVGGSACYYVGGTDVAVADGGTGLSAWVVGDLVAASGVTTLAGIAAVATGSVLISAGTGTLPTWSTDLATGVTIGTAYIYRVGGTDVAAADGGTGQSSYAVGDLLYADTTTSLAKLADVETGQVLASGGVNTAPAYTASPSLTSLTLAPTAALVGLTMTAALHTQTAGVIDLNVTAAATGVVGFDCSMTTPDAGLGDGESMYAHSIALVGDAQDHANSIVYGINFGFTANAGAAKARALYVPATFTYSLYSLAPLYVGATNIETDTTTGMQIGTGSTQKLGFWGHAAVVQPTAMTAQSTTITHSAPGTPDYAIADLVNVSGYGFTTLDEGLTVLAVIANLQARVAELEARLTGCGIIAAAA